MIARCWLKHRIQVALDGLRLRWYKPPRWQHGWFICLRCNQGWWRMSDPETPYCSSFLGAWIEANWPQARGCCRRHDDAYERGGSERERLIADVQFFLDLLLAGLPMTVAEQMYNAVRIFGGWGHFNFTSATHEQVPASVTFDTRVEAA